MICESCGSRYGMEYAPVICTKYDFETERRCGGYLMVMATLDLRIGDGW